ncbi:uncharacterized protein F4812DRAFT_414323 [Daldinia caldariorum]|uniref:uncharacterized protein n=1 Tax=Daldinia caldariorum TaxID=326644 RepID=UPI00200776A9|nr:uncharacterized protein F4812DRAFT_414323 [Daldinia caldariorum]KAI1471501.1 hypothetical protein F4812DRAFT_414323 [Daldinia caldariorum]
MYLLPFVPTAEILLDLLPIAFALHIVVRYLGMLAQQISVLGLKTNPPRSRSTKASQSDGVTKGMVKCEKSSEAQGRNRQIKV